MKPVRARKSSEGTETAERILDLAERLVQTRGFNGFSYADIAAEIGITKASLHYHFPTKAALGARLIERYHERFIARIEALRGEAENVAESLRRYAAIYVETFRADRFCLCGMLAAEYATLPKPMRAAVVRFFDANEGWLAALLAEGRRSGVLRFSEEPAERAALLVAALEGALLLARAHRDVARLEASVARLLADVGVAPVRVPTDDFAR